jgi:hyperosmotically inducible protein
MQIKSDEKRKLTNSEATMKHLRLNIALLIMALLLAAPIAHADNADTPSGAPDNTQMNLPDRNTLVLTADQAGNQKSDLQIMAGIRKAVVADKSLSTYAHNIKIIASNGKVTLKGPVQSADESKNIEDKATQVAGIGNVTNRLSVKPSN